MAITYKVYDFPNLPVRGQLFYAGGQSFEAGFTSGGIRVGSPEPGGRAFLDVELSLQVGEWENPFVSWLMSKTNGQIFKVPLTATPQLVAREKLAPGLGIPWNNDQPWDNNQLWQSDDVSAAVTQDALEGSVILKVDLTVWGPILKAGHVIGHTSNSYLVDEITYVGNLATIVVNPPLRKDVPAENRILFRPLFTGSIINGAEMRVAYEAINSGFIKPSRILFSEVIL